MCLRSEEAGEKRDSVAEKIIVERADLGTRIKFLYMKRRCRLHKRARLSCLTLALGLGWVCVIILGSRQMQRAPLMRARVFESTFNLKLLD